ncbi:MAG: hypothetical protein GW942_02870 [Candidatus Pacebacteria bacterium]|nr:hypothetical protein [Candidatus Paceibacterota bacterium]
MSKGILIIPVEVVTSGPGCGGFITLALIILFLFSAFTDDGNNNRQTNPRNTSSPVSTPVQSINSAPRSQIDTSGSVNVTSSSQFIQTLGSIPKSQTESVYWTGSREIGLIGVTTFRMGKEGRAMVFNQSGVIADLSIPMGFNPRGIRLEERSFDLKIDDLNDEYTNFDHLRSATNLPSYPVRISVTSMVRNRNGVNQHYDIILTWRDDGNFSHLCEVNSDPLDYELYNWMVNETGYYTAYDGNTLYLWDWNCREVMRYSSAQIIDTFELNHSLVITREGGVLFVEEYENEYLVRYIKI